MSLRGAGGGAIGALIASLCCLLPLLLLIAGVSVTAGLTVSQYRPFFLLLGVLFVVFYILVNLHYRARVCACSFREVFMRERGFVLATSGAFLVLFTVINILIVPLLTGAMGGVENQVDAQSLRGVELKISGMTCPSCAEVIEEMLGEEAGIVRAEVSYENAKAVVIFDPGKISVDDIVEKVKPYKAEVVSEWEVKG